MKRAVVLGGTGLLGSRAVVSLVDRGYEVTSVSSTGRSMGRWYPAQVKQIQADVFAMGSGELTALFAGHDAVVHGLGPDDRVVPSAPAGPFFQQRLVDTTDRVCDAARKAGVTQVVVFGSYFTYLDRSDPDRRLAERHPYIQARAKQMERCLKHGGPEMSVAVLEIPYVFGTMPEREPLWMDVLVRRIHHMKPWVFFPPGGTVMCSARFVGELTAAIFEKGHTGPIPVGEQNMDWVTLLRIATEELYGSARRVVTIPATLAMIYGGVEQAVAKLRGLEPGLSYRRYIGDVHARQSYFPEEVMTSVSEEFGVPREPVSASIRETFARCASL